MGTVAKVKLEVWGYRCERCGHLWVPRDQDAPPAKTCPKCKSPYWDRPRRTETDAHTSNSATPSKQLR